MSGKAGRSGRRPKSAALHVLQGTWRPDRHGPRPVTVGATALQAPAGVPAVPAAVVKGLGERGLQFALDVWTAYGEWSPAALVLLREAGQLVDALEDYKTRIAADGCLLTSSRGTMFAHPLLRSQHQARATLLALLAGLNLKEK